MAQEPQPAAAALTTAVAGELVDATGLGARAAEVAAAAMGVQFIELADPVERTLFEVYAALALDTSEFNSFETH